jgi:NADH-quinone oxidoreductase subunit J
MIANAALNVFAAIALVSALAMLVLRHPMRVAVSLIVCMLSLAGIYALLGVHVIAVFQVLIYVGAVMVFMVYVIMLIDPREAGFVRFSKYALPAAIGFVVFAVLLGLALVHGDVAPKGPSGAPFGVQSFSEAFLEQYWLYFELTSVLLVAAVVAAIAVVKIGGKRRG